MNTYKLLINGWEFNGSAHFITEDDIETIENLQTYYDTEDLSLIVDELSSELKWNPIQGNIWTLNRPLEWDQANFTLVDEEDNEIWSVSYTEIGDVYDLHKKYGLGEHKFDNQEDTKLYQFKKDSSTLCYYEQNKGTICSLTINSTDIPLPNDFGVSTIEINTNRKNINIIQDVFHKTDKLKWDFSTRDVQNKSINLFIHTPFIFDIEEYDELIFD